MTKTYEKSETKCYKKFLSFYLKPNTYSFFYLDFFSSLHHDPLSLSLSQNIFEFFLLPSKMYSSLDTSVCMRYYPPLLDDHDRTNVMILSFRLSSPISQTPHLIPATCRGLCTWLELARVGHVHRSHSLIYKQNSSLAFVFSVV